MSELFVMNGHVDGLMTPTIPFGMAVNLGLAPGYQTLDKFGVNTVIATNTDPEDIWEFGGEYIYDAWGTAPIKYISSSSSLDVGQTIGITGLDIEGNEVVQLAITDGQNNVELDIPLYRVYRLENNADAAIGDILGILYCHIDPTTTLGVPLTTSVRAIINGFHNQTLMALLTIPKGKVGLLCRGELGVELEGNAAALAEFARCHYVSRRLGKLWKVKKALSLIVGGGIYTDRRTFTDVIPALTDVRLTCIEVSRTMGMWGTLDVLLVDEEKLNKDWLRKIGQPGY